MTFDEAQQIIEGRIDRDYPRSKILEAAQKVLEVRLEAAQEILEVRQEATRMIADSSVTTNELQQKLILAESKLALFDAIPPLDANTVAGLIQSFYEGASSRPFNAITSQLAEHLAKELRWVTFQSVGLHPTKTCGSCGKHRIELAEREGQECHLCRACTYESLIQWRRSEEEERAESPRMVIEQEGQLTARQFAPDYCGRLPGTSISLSSPPRPPTPAQSEYERDLLNHFDRMTLAGVAQNTIGFDPPLEAALRDAAAAPSITDHDRAYRDYALRLGNLTYCGIINHIPDGTADLIRNYGFDETYFWIMIHGLIEDWITELHHANALDRAQEYIWNLMQNPAVHFGWRSVPQWRGEVSVEEPTVEEPFRRSRIRYSLVPSLWMPNGDGERYSFDTPTNLYSYLSAGGGCVLSCRTYTHRMEFREDQATREARRRIDSSDVLDRLAVKVQQRLRYLVECEVSEALSQFEHEPNDDTTRMRIQGVALQVLQRHRIGGRETPSDNPPF